VGISPAALMALLKGDFENAIVASTPGGIEAQEAAGQKSFVADTTLPIKCDYCTREQLEQMGIVFGEPVDDLFVEVQLPEGRKKVATSHSMHSDLLDDRGRKRAGIYYKAAFYDRRAGISLEHRFHVFSEPVGGWSGYDRHTTPFIVVIRDCGEIVWEAEVVGPVAEEYSEGGVFEKKWKIVARHWLDEYYPDWENPLAHWD